MKQWIIDRLKERSTWLGLTGLLTAAGIALNQEQIDQIIAAGAASGGLIAVFTKG